MMISLPKHTPMTTNEAAAYVFIWVLVWGAMTLALLSKYERRKGDEWVSRVVSVAHAVVSGVLAAIAMYDSLPEAWLWFASPTSFYQQLALGVSIAYFIVDFVGIWYGSYYDTLFIWHHICSGWGLGIAHFGGTCGFELCVCLWAMETSNPFLHSRWVLLSEGFCEKESSLLHWITELFWWNFSLCRITFGTPYTTMMILSANEPWLLKFLGGAIMVFSWKFWIEMMGKRRRNESWR